ncbi:hypothetical protein BFP97_16350 [Roseivirga sp. 4D4]|uniref:hypothetical protein n=1 Tax=Roseivirga sp. 4D4 TaxID=1889784 RepID=UPI000853322F|nr:hypothetical protein [Roseivirga sp. 4D4]OEK02997.1 hypothetical protein BFP97_16350 [Roseivirga sp. 4D4]
MKIQKYISMVFVLAVLLVSACKSDDGAPTATELAFERLAGSWSMGTQGSIVLDGEDVSSNYPGFTLSFADGTYQTTNGGDLFRASGTWRWTGDTGRLLILDTGEEVTINNLTLTEFEFSFFHAGTTPVRAGIQGNYTVSVSK